jgi:hypothetical protein
MRFLIVILSLMFLMVGCSTMRGKRVNARYARRMARSPKQISIEPMQGPAHVQTRTVIIAPPPNHRPYTPVGSPLIQSRVTHVPMGSDMYCNGQACRDRGSSRQWHRGI